VNAQGVPPGYKQTEVGVIPQDWEVKELAGRVSLFSGQHILAKEYTTKEGGTPYLTGPSDFPNGRTHVSKWTDHPKVVARQGDILITVKGSGAGGVFSLDLQEAAISRQLMAIRSNELFQEFLFYSLQKEEQFLALRAVGNLIPGLSRNDVLSLRLPLPPTLSEQRAIAAALSDVDALIAALDKLIAKKRAIKTAAMQQLLTGKQRVPGFEKEKGYKQTEVGMIPEDWDVKSLRDLVDFANGKPHEGDVESKGRFFLVTLDSIGIDGKLKGEHKAIDFLDQSLQRNDIVAILSDLAHGNLLGLCDLIPEDDKYVLNQRVGRLRLKTSATPQFVRLQINSRQDHFKKRGQGTSQRHIYKRDFDALVIPHPPEREQPPSPPSSLTWTPKSPGWRPVATRRRSSSRG
jgi:restriction endonuclease S subunit